jgi:hypothetical protein
MEATGTLPVSQEEDYPMSMLAHRADPAFRAPKAIAVLPKVRWTLHAGTIRRLLMSLATILSSGVVLTAIIALKTAAYLWRFHL